MITITEKFWLAKDKNGELYFYASLPERNEKDGCWEGDYITEKGYEFPSVEWEDEPREIELKIKC